MTKIRVSKGVKEVEGELRELVVKPFGTSSHITLSKRDIGKNVSVIIPDDAILSWVGSEEEKTALISFCEKKVKESSGKLGRYKKEALDNFKKSRFKLDDLAKVVAILKDFSYDEDTIRAIEIDYNLNSEEEI
jgi:putative transposon-encoded protein